jgi:hypothetical protein
MKQMLELLIPAKIAKEADEDPSLILGGRTIQLFSLAPSFYTPDLGLSGGAMCPNTEPAPSVLESSEATGSRIGATLGGSVNHLVKLVPCCDSSSGLHLN